RRTVPVTAFTRHDEGVDVMTGDGRVETFDSVVLATHADQALAVLADATPEEKQDLGAITYSINQTVLHRDCSLLPPRTAARASWNHRTACGDDAAAAEGSGVTVSYWMNRLQGLDDADDYVVTLNGAGLVDPESVIAEMSYAHPVFTPAAVEAAQRLRTAG